MQRIFVICKDTNVKGLIGFYVCLGDSEYFMFTQKFRHSLYEHFKSGLPLEKALKYPSYQDTAISNAIRRIIPNIRYIEKEYDIKILNKSQKSA